MADFTGPKKDTLAFLYLPASLPGPKKTILPIPTSSPK